MSKPCNNHLTSSKQVKDSGTNSALELYSRNIPHAPSVFEFRNQYHNLIFFGILACVYATCGQEIWTNLYANWNIDDLGFSATYILTSVLYWGWSFFFFILDSYPEKFNRYRVQNFRETSSQGYKKAFITGLVNSFLVSAPYGYILHLIYKQRTKDIDMK
jgi:hypothetical protein